MAQMNLTPLDDVLDKHFGKVGTPKRDDFESDVSNNSFRKGTTIKWINGHQEGSHRTELDTRTTW